MKVLHARALTMSLPGAHGPVPVLRGVDLDVEPGETVGLVGESGSGKSMTALAAMRLEPDGARLGGALRGGGLDLLRATEAGLCAYRGRGAAIVFQEPMTALDPIMRIEAQVAECLRDQGRASSRTRAKALLARVGLAPPHADPRAWPHQLSGGQRQRAVIAMALAQDPALLIADEPTSALDVLVRQAILDLLAALVAERGMALLLIGHDLAMMRRRVRRVLVMYAGRVVEEGPAEFVLERPCHPYTRALLDASPRAVGMPRPLPGRAPAPGERADGCAFAPRCPRAASPCRELAPPLRGHGAHRAACWHPIA